MNFRLVATSLLERWYDIEIDGERQAPAGPASPPRPLRMVLAMDEPTHLLEVDDRGRTSLARLGGSGRRYLAHTEPDGTIVLEPAVVMTELEARLHANPELHARITDAAAHPERAVPSSRGKRSAT